MLVLVLAPILFAYTWWLGGRLISGIQISLWEKRWLSPMVGFSILVFIATALSFLGALFPAYIYGTLAFLAAVAFCIGRLTHEPFDLTEGEEKKGALPTPKSLATATLSVSLLVGVHTLLCVLTPEVRSDPVRYHISMANQYAVRGGIEPLRETVWWSVPQYAECLYALGISLCNDTLSKLFHWWAGVLSTLGIFALGNRWFGKTAACWAVLLWVTTPMVSYEATTTYVELVLTLWILLSVWAAGRALEEHDARKGAPWLCLSGFALGLAFGTKYTAFGVQGLAWFLFPSIYLFRHRRKQVAWVAVLLTIAFVGLGYSPWLLRNGFLTGNPVYPLYNHLFGLIEGVDRGAELYFLTVWPGYELLNPGYYGEKLIRFFHAGYNFPGIALAVFVYLFVTRSPGRKSPSKGKLLRPELGFCFLSFTAYVLLTKNNDGRFWLPTLAVFLPILGEGLARVIRGMNERKKGVLAPSSLVSVALIVLCLYNYIGQRATFFRNFRESPWPILSEEARWDYYAEHERGDPIGRHYEKLIPRGAIVFGLRFPEKVHSVSSDQEQLFDREGRLFRSNRVPLLDPFMESDRTPEAFIGAARTAGVDFVILPNKEKPLPEEFWRTAALVGIPVEEGEGRLLAIPSLETYLEPKPKGFD